jgi:hypothetical protein
MGSHYIMDLYALPLPVMYLIRQFVCNLGVEYNSLAHGVNSYVSRKIYNVGLYFHNYTSFIGNTALPYFAAKILYHTLKALF